jgi:hypothetical protein
MTIREWAERYCRDRGVTPDEAKEIVDQVVVDPDMYVMHHRWDRGIASLPPAIFDRLETHMKSQVIKWREKSRIQP